MQQGLLSILPPGINMESGGVNSHVLAAVSNVKSIYRGVSEGVQTAECDRSSSLPEEDEVLIKMISPNIPGIYSICSVLESIYLWHVNWGAALFSDRHRCSLELVQCGFEKVSSGWGW